MIAPRIPAEEIGIEAARAKDKDKHPETIDETLRGTTDDMQGQEIGTTRDLPTEILTGAMIAETIEATVEVVDIKTATVPTGTDKRMERAD